MRFLYTLAALLLVTAAAQAFTRFEPGKKYRIVCQEWPAGNVVPGAEHGKLATVFYDAKGAENEYRWWYIERYGDGSVSFRNAQTGQYITYAGVNTSLKRNLELTDEMHGDSSRWVITADDSHYVVSNKGVPVQRLNVRTGSYIVGSYTDTTEPTQNERFFFYNESGDKVYGIDTGPMSLLWLAKNITFGGKPLVYDSLYQTFIFPLTTQCRDENAFRAVLDYETGEPNTCMEIEGDRVSAGGSHTFKDITGGRTFEMALRNDTGIIATAPLTFTFLPIIEMTGTGFSRSTYRPGTIRVHEPNNLNQDPVIHMKARYRGASSSTLNKKAYAVKLTDAAGNDLDYSFLGLRSDNNWILDAMAIDPGRMRNRISTDLWNDFATPPYYKQYEPKALHGTRGRFVEVLLNEHYAGLYCFTEKLDRKQLKLTKYDTSAASGQNAIRGCLYKSAQWGYSVFMGYDQSSNTFPRRALSGYSNNSDTWSNWELKYPDLDEGESIDWGPLYNAVNIPATADDYTFRMNVARYFDLPVVRDYYLFIELIVGFDNNGKNMYWYTYDKTRFKMLSLAPWDMDGTWGRNWDGSKMDWSADIDFTPYMNDVKHSRHALFKRLISLNFNKWNEQLADRYAELRSTYFQADKLFRRFSDYKELFDDSGAMEREKQRWNGSNGIYIDMDGEMTYMESWIRRRLEAMDRTYGYVDAIETVKHASELNVYGGKGVLYIHTSLPQEVTVFTPEGMAVRTVTLKSGRNSVENLSRGIYIVKGKKAIVE